MMDTYRITYTRTSRDSLDFSAPGEAEALEAFWQLQHRNRGPAWGGEITEVNVTTHKENTQP